jgi:hypothetical protein
LAILAATLVAFAAVFVAQASAAASNSLGQAEAARQQLNLDLLAAARGGYTEQDVEPILDRQQALTEAAAPIGLADRAVFYRRQAQELSALRLDLSALEAHQLELLRRATQTRLADLLNELAQDEKMGVEAADIEPLRAQAEQVRLTLSFARGPLDFRHAFGDMGGPIDKAEQLRITRAADIAAVQAEADRLLQAASGNLDSVRKVGLDALDAGRNFATAEAYLRVAPGRPYDLLESNANRLQGTTLEDVALAAALEERYRDQIHGGLLASLPHKLIFVAIVAEELWAYEDGKLFVNTLVTTGMPQLPTDTGLMRIARKESPVHFISPFPHGSVYDYGSINAKYALWFHPAGEAIHDSWWRSWYGPGSNLNGRGSHGCIGVPYGPIDSLYLWSDVGTAVLVIPGDGSPVASQLNEKTYDDPFWGPGPPV